MQSRSTQHARAITTPTRYLYVYDPRHSPAGLGTRIKVIEALVQEKTLVATSFAPAGLGLKSEKHFVAADSAGELARACAELLANSGRRRTHATAGRAYVVENFDCNRIEESIADFVPSGM
jgi:glycosyltransferase involved in cell wall biosynthesis